MSARDNDWPPWTVFSALSLPPGEFVLVYVVFASKTNPGARPRKLRAYYSTRDGYWRTPYGRLEGTVTHWVLMPPDPPEASDVQP